MRWNFRHKRCYGHDSEHRLVTFQRDEEIALYVNSAVSQAYFFVKKVLDWQLSVRLYLFLDFDAKLNDTDHLR